MVCGVEWVWVFLIAREGEWCWSGYFNPSGVGGVKVWFSVIFCEWEWGWSGYKMPMFAVNEIGSSSCLDICTYKYRQNVTRKANRKLSYILQCTSCMCFFVISKSWSVYCGADLM